MEINVTNIKLKEVNKIIKQLNKLYKDVHLKSHMTKTGKKTLIVFMGRRKL